MVVVKYMIQDVGHPLPGNRILLHGLEAGTFKGIDQTFSGHTIEIATEDHRTIRRVCLVENHVALLRIVGT